MSRLARKPPPDAVVVHDFDALGRCEAARRLHARLAALDPAAPAPPRCAD